MKFGIAVVLSLLPILALGDMKLTPAECRLLATYLMVESRALHSGEKPVYPEMTPNSLKAARFVTEREQETLKNSSQTEIFTQAFFACNAAEGRVSQEASESSAPAGRTSQ